MREDPLVTNASARDLVRGGDHDEDINAAWSAGKDTRAIASDLGVREAEVANRLTIARAGDWPDEEAACLRRLWDAGNSAREIASVLGRTRNAVLGKVHRLGLAERRPAYQQAPRTKPEADNDRRLTQVLKRQEKARRQRERALARLRPPEFKREAPTTVTVRPDHQFLNVDLLDLNRDECRYSPSKEPPFLFCGQPALAGKSWCAHCYGLVFQPPKLRRERNPWHPTPGIAA